MIKSIDNLSLENISGICDHTYLNRPEAFLGKNDNPIKAWNNEFNFFLQKTIEMPSAPYGVCVRHDNVDYVKRFLGKNKSYIKTVATAGFPYGNCSFGTKKGEVLIAIDDGADEVDVVMNHSMLRDKNTYFINWELNKLNKIIHNYGVISKVILETSELNNDEIRLACRIANEAGFDFVKTSTGFGSRGASPEDLKIMRQYFPRGVKISGSVKKENVYHLLEAASGRNDRMIELNPMEIRVGESGLITSLMGEPKG